MAGDCLDEKQCKQCANKVLQHMKAMQADQERERQRRLEVEREAEKKREAKQRAKEAQEREVRKREKAEEKERRRKEYDALKASKREPEKKPKKETNQASSELPSAVREGVAGDAQMCSGMGERASLQTLVRQSDPHGLGPLGGVASGMRDCPWEQVCGLASLCSQRHVCTFWSEVAESITRTASCTFCKSSALASLARRLELWPED